MKNRRELVIAALVVLATRLMTLARSLWEFDEPLFIQAVTDYEPLLHHPPPPGYPVFILLAKLLNVLIRDPFISLVILSVVASVVGFAAMAIAFGRLCGDDRTGILGAALFYFSPVMLVHSTLPISDPAALAFLAVTLLVMTQLLGYGTSSPIRRDAVAFGVFAGLTIGCRPQFSIAVVPMVLWVILVAPGRRFRIPVTAAFALTCMLWLIPFVMLSGGPARWWDWMGSQAGYFAQHDAAISRGNISPVQIAFRFVAHPWGPKWLSFPLLLAAAVGSVRMFRHRSRGVVAFALLTIPYLGFALIMMDPADGPRYALPSLPFVAFLAASAFMPPTLGVPGARSAPLLYCVAAAIYVSPMIRDRVSSASPPVQAAEYARANVPRDSVILYELPLWPHAELLLASYKISRIDEGLRVYAQRPDVPVVLYADGERGNAEGMTFRWRQSDAYGKLTRNHYRVVSIISIPAAERYQPIRGVYPSERTVKGEQWRWLDQDAAVELPDLGRSQVALTLGTNEAYPLAENRVTISVNGLAVRTLTFKKHESQEAIVDLPPGKARIEFHSDRSFIPAELPTRDRDPRRLSVMLLHVRQL
jgi:hypothetical protein